MDKEQFGPFLAEQRKQHKITQGQLAESVHVSTAAVSKWERGLCLPEITKLEDIARTLDLSLMEVMQCRKNEIAAPVYPAEEVQEVLRSAVRLSGSEVKSSKKKILSLQAALCIALVILLCAAYLFFSRPRTLSQLYPMLCAEECTGISGYYETGTRTEPVEFHIAESDEAYQRLLNLLNGQEYRRKLADLFPAGTKAHLRTPGDFRWELSLRFEGITMPDGSVTSGSLSFHNWYGELEIYFLGDRYACVPTDSSMFDSVFDLISAGDLAP